MKTEEMAAHIIMELFRDRKIGGAHTSDANLSDGPLAQVEQSEFVGALQFLDTQSFILRHAKGRLGKGEQVALNPENLTAALELAYQHLPESRRDRFLSMMSPALRQTFVGEQDKEVDAEKEQPGFITRDEVMKILGDYVPENTFRTAIRDVRSTIRPTQVIQQAPSRDDKDQAKLFSELQSVRQSIESLRKRVDSLPDYGPRIKEIEGRVDRVDDLADLVSSVSEHLVDLTDTVQNLAVGEECWFRGCKKSAAKPISIQTPSKGKWDTLRQVTICADHAKAWQYILMVDGSHASQIHGLINSAAKKFKEGNVMILAKNGDPRAIDVAEQLRRIQITKKVKT